MGTYSVEPGHLLIETVKTPLKTYLQVLKWLKQRASITYRCTVRVSHMHKLNRFKKKGELGILIPEFSADAQLRPSTFESINLDSQLLFFFFKLAHVLKCGSILV
jgi:hypothetical protein